MADLIDKLTSYNLFNYLFPGAVFAAIVTKITSYNLVQEDIFTGFFIYYFIGLIISRIGSLIIEPLLKGVKFVNYSNYKDFVKAEKEDQKLSSLVESNNTYRTICSMLLAVAATYSYEKTELKCQLLADYRLELVVFLLLVLFLFSFRKQSRYITKRVEAHKGDK